MKLSISASGGTGADKLGDRRQQRREHGLRFDRTDAPKPHRCGDEPGRGRITGDRDRVRLAHAAGAPDEALHHGQVAERFAGVDARAQFRCAVACPSAHERPAEHCRCASIRCATVRRASPPRRHDRSRQLHRNRHRRDARARPRCDPRSPSDDEGTSSRHRAIRPGRAERSWPRAPRSRWKMRSCRSGTRNPRVAGS